MKASSLTANRASVGVLAPNIARYVSISTTFCLCVTAPKRLLNGGKPIVNAKADGKEDQYSCRGFFAQTVFKS